MMRRLTVPACALAAGLGASAVLASSSAYSQAPEPSAPSAGKHAFSAADRAAFLDARIAALHAGLKLSPEQEKLWPSVEAAIRKAGQDSIERFQKMKEAKEAGSLIDRLRRRGENLAARGQDLQTIANAAAPLYASLTEEQKHRLPVLMHALRPGFHHHFAMMEGQPEHWGPQRSEPDEEEGSRPLESDHAGQHEH